MRWILRSVLALVVFAGVALGAVFFIPAEKIAGVAVDKFNAQTGRELRISGSVRPSFWPQLGVKTGPVTISNAEWSKEGPMLQAEGLEISLDVASLFNGVFKITGVEALSPKIVLERSAKGQENWVLGDNSGGSANASGQAGSTPFTLDKALISNGSVTFIDHGTGARYDLGQIAAEVAIPDFAGPARVDLAAVMNGQPFKVSANVAGFQDLLGGKLVGLEVSLRAGDADVGFKGRAGIATMEAEGDLSAKLGNLKAISALAGAAVPALPEGLGARVVQVAGALTVTAKASVHLRSGRITLDSNALAADVDLTTAGERPKLSAKVVAGSLNLAALSKGEGGGAGGGVAAAGWPKDRIDLSGLSAMDAEVSISARGLDLGMVKFGSSQVMLTLDRGRMVTQLRRVEAYGGTIAGEAVVNGRKGLSVGGDLKFDGVDLQALLRDIGGFERLVGRGDLTVKYLGSGNSVDAIMHSLEGSGSFVLRRGAIVGLDIAGMLQRMDPSYVGEGQRTIFDGLTGSYTINAGVLRNDDLLLQSSDLTAKGAGEVGLGARNQSYRIAATALANDQGKGGLTVPLLITGTWADPKFALDLQSLADKKLAEEKAKLEARLKEEAKAKEKELKAKAKEKLKSELGIEQKKGESLEDAAKRAATERLNKEAAKALNGLLGGN